MEKESVILIRDSLINDGSHRIVEVLFDNGTMLNVATDQILWDDDKEIIIGITTDYDASNLAVDLPIKIIASTYENIQFFTCTTNVKINKTLQDTEKLETIIDRISTNIHTISVEDKNKIINYYTKLTDGKHELLRNVYLPSDIIRDKQEEENNNE